MQLSFVPALVIVSVFGLGIGGAYAAGNVSGRAASKPAASAPVSASAPAEAASPADNASGTPSAGGTQRGFAGAAVRPSASGAQPAQGDPASQTGQTGQAGQGGQNAGRAVNGTVEKFEGGKLTITSQQGSSSVAVASGVTVLRSVPGAVSDIKPGDRVLVTLRPSSDGSSNAASIQILPADSR